MPDTVPVDAWGEVIDLPPDMLRLEEDGQWAVRCRSWADSTVYCRGHRSNCGGHRWSPDTDEAREEHPVGEVLWCSAHQCFGTVCCH